MLPQLLAQAPDATALKEWIQIFAWLCGVIIAAAVAWAHVSGRGRERTITPQPLEIREHTKIATQGDLDQVHGRIKRERMEIDTKLGELREEQQRLREKLDEDISDLNSRIDAVPARTIQLLKDTKGLI